jgi:hypothetical protein
MSEYFALNGDLAASIALERERIRLIGSVEPMVISDRIIDMRAAIAQAATALPYRVRPFALDATVTLLVGRTGESKT